MAQFGIGELPRHQAANQQLLSTMRGGDVRPSPAARAGALGAADPPPELVADMTEANRELFSFFGAPQSQLDEAGGGAAEGLAQQLAALAGQAAQIGGSRGAAGVSCSGNDQQPAASSGLQSKISAARGSAADSSHLTHVDASGKAAMVDVSHVSARCLNPGCPTGPPAAMPTGACVVFLLPAKAARAVGAVP